MCKKIILKITLLFVFQVYILSQQVNNINLQGNYIKTPLTGLFTNIQNEHGIQFYYKKLWFETDTITVEFNNTPLLLFLDSLCDYKFYTYKTIQNNLIVFMPKDAVKQLTGETPPINTINQNNIVLVGNSANGDKFKKSTIKGTVKDGKTGELLIGATIQIENTTIATPTNVKGLYTLTVEPGSYSLIVSNVGYEKSTVKVKVISTGELNFELFEEPIKIEQVTVFSKRRDLNVRSNQMSLIEIDAKDLKQLPSITGDKDIIKSFTMMPGVKSVGEFGSGINVRGGGEDQNLFLIEGAPIFNTSHVFGLLSVLNPDAVTNVVLYKGQIPAMYGERVASVMDIKIIDNKPKPLKTKGGIGLYDSRLLFEGPIGSNLNFKLGGRTSYSNWLMQQMPDINLQKSSASFYDINASLNWNYKKNHISLFSYISNDNFSYSNELAFNYGNKLGSLNWEHNFTPNLTSNLTLAYSNYNAGKDNLKYEFEKTRFTTQMQYKSAKYNFKFTKIANHTINTGVQAINYSIMPGQLQPLNALSIISDSALLHQQAWETGFYINNAWDINQNLTLNIGFRVSGFYNLGPTQQFVYNLNTPKLNTTVNKVVNIQQGKVANSYFSFEPRLSVKYLINAQNSLKLSYNRNAQYLSLISYTAISVPTDVWKLADNNLKPILSDQIALGYYRNNANNDIETSVEVYYKKLSNLLEYKNNAVIELNPNLEQQLLNAEGKNYGLEVMIKKKEGKTDGWISYTYSRSLRITNAPFQEKINNGNWFPSAYDKPHSLTVFCNYHINKRWRMAANFSYATGRPITMPEYTFRSGNDVLIVWSDRNKYRTPDYHRLDISISMDESLRISKRWKGSWTFSILNVYARHNTYSVFYRKDTPTAANNYEAYALYQLFIIGQPLPTLTYNFIF